ncbi:lipoprotein-releasing ABC transporter permease subunit [Candidatus Pseudomonas adelgestsugas]|uniref:Lipoprotein-releasing system transmembrane protein LolC n=1 Tax=Candidatus Pseudomonas adelgestsugas TaxID=1302376 RepID=A0ABX5R8Q9_9PSED|nr:lipoprotein-releasing ABC transporter permease subunit [Candidatus Pseudomonas adelgestsugas]QAX82032.1 Lipoprotein-releasing system transmembrane protein LolC [Candidatus Pseudomonas adelgestsugas]
MFRPLSVFIGMRYTRAKHRNHFLSFISIVSIIGLALGVAVMIVVLSVMNGFDHEMRTRVLGMVPHAIIESYEPISDWQSLADQVMKASKVMAVAPFTQIPGLLAYDGKVQKILLNGIEPSQESNVSIIDHCMLHGKLNDLVPGKFGIVIGDKAAVRFSVGIGDKLTFIAPEVIVTPAGMFPCMKRFTVVGIFHVGAAEIDGYLCLTNLIDLAHVHRWQSDQVQGLRLKFHSLFDAPLSALDIVKHLGESKYYAIDWTRTHGNLYQAIRMEKAVIGLLLLLIIAIAAFNIISMLVIIVNNKTSDIAILRTIGVMPRQIISIFIVEGTLIGMVGTLIGTVFGILCALNIRTTIAALERVIGYTFLNADIYFIDYVPSKVQTQDVFIVGCAALFLSFIATLYPAWRAACTQPSHALRYE